MAAPAPIPPAALAVIAAALDDYRITTPPDLATPEEQAEQIAQYLLSSGYRITPDTRDTRQTHRCGIESRPPGGIQ